MELQAQRILHQHGVKLISGTYKFYFFFLFDDLIWIIENKSGNFELLYIQWELEHCTLASVSIDKH